MHRLALVLACISLAWVAISLTCSAIAFIIAGPVVLPILMPMIVANLANVAINLVTLTLVSPNRDTFHYPRRLWRRFASLARRIHSWGLAAWKTRDDRRRAAAERAIDMDRPARSAWNVLTSPGHAMTDARRSRLEGLRFRADIVTDRLTGSLDIADIQALVLLDKTLGEIADAYRQALKSAPSDKARRAIDRRVEETLDQMLTAAETRLRAADAIVDQRLDAVLQHAQDSSRRLLDR